MSAMVNCDMHISVQPMTSRVMIPTKSVVVNDTVNVKVPYITNIRTILTGEELCILALDAQKDEGKARAETWKTQQKQAAAKRQKIARGWKGCN